MAIGNISGSYQSETDYQSQVLVGLFKPKASAPTGSGAIGAPPADKFTTSQNQIPGLASEQRDTFELSPQMQAALDKADRDVVNAWLAYLKSAAHPPLPPPLRPVDRTGRELKKYFDELAQALTQEARRKLGEASRLIEDKAEQALLFRSLSDLARSERNPT